MRFIHRITDHIHNAGVVFAFLLAANAIPLIVLAWGIRANNLYGIIAFIPLALVFTVLAVLLLIGGMANA